MQGEGELAGKDGGGKVKLDVAGEKGRGNRRWKGEIEEELYS